MNRTRPLLTAALAATLTLAACQTETASSDTDAPAGEVAESPTRSMTDMGPYTDARFLQEMTAHHRMALDMARMAPSMAASADLKAMATTMIADQTREIDEMNGFLRAMGETPDTTGMAGMNAGGGGEANHSMAGMDHGEAEMGMPVTMAELRATRPFDRAWLASMIGHHSTAVTMSTEAQLKTENADVRRLATAIIRAQADEIGRMQRMIDAMPAAAMTPGSASPADSAMGR